MKKILIAVFALSSFAAAMSGQGAKPLSGPVTASVYLRERTNATQWFSATPFAEVYGHQDSLLRLSLSQRLEHLDWTAEIGQSSELGLPTDAVLTVAAQGQLGLGANYYANNANNQFPAAVSFRQGFVRYHFKRDSDVIRAGRFEFVEGQEMAPKDSTLGWLQTNRMAHRLVGNFGFSNGQRSFDGVDGKVGGARWDVTAMAGRAIQGVFNMNANPELNVDIQYLGYTRLMAKQRVVARVFGLGYHDGRTGLTKTDNRTTAARALDHKNIRIGSYGADVLAAVPVGKSTADFLVWSVLQNGTWGLLDHRAAAVAVEGGLRFTSAKTMPWVRGGMLRTTGDNNNADGTHNTFFQVLPTPRIFARFPYFNMMNSKDEFVQIIDKPSSKMDVRADLHFLQLTAPTDFWYQGGGAYDNKVFGYVGRPGNNHGSLSTLADVSLDYALNKQLTLSGYYAKSFGKSVVGAIYTTNRNAQYGYFELTYRIAKTLRKVGKP